MSERCQTCDREGCPLWATRLQYRAARAKAVEIAKRERGQPDSDEYIAAVGECTRLWELLDEEHPNCTPVDWRAEALRMRPVVEAAVEFTDSAIPPLKLFEAVDAYRKEKP